MKQTLNILHLEDSSNDAALVQAALTKSGFDYSIQLAATREQYLQALEKHQYDLILSDGSIPGFEGVSAMDTARERYPTIPFIFVSAHPVAPAPTSSSSAYAGYVAKSQLEQLGTAILNALHHSEFELQKAPTEMPTITNTTELKLINVIQELSLTRSLDAIMAIIRRAARELTGADGATFVLREHNLCYYAEENAIGPLWKGRRFPMSTCISGWVMQHKQSAVIEDIYADPRIPADAYRPTFVKSLAMVPIRTQAPLGAIGNYWATTHHASPEQLQILQILANSTAIAMENVALYNELEQRVNDRTEQLQDLNKELEAFSYSISHDLKAPLRHIDGFGQLLLSECADDLDEDGKNYLHHITLASQRMGDLIDDLLRLSLATRAELNLGLTDLSQIAREISHELQSTEPERHIEIDITENIVVAHADQHLLRIAMENLFANAWKYTSKTPQAQISFSITTNADDETVYYVRDNGAGFDMAYASKLFSPFQRLHTNNDFPGNGVGLATVQRIIRKHSGQIWAEAEKDKGATFFFTLAKPQEK